MKISLIGEASLCYQSEASQLIINPVFHLSFDHERTLMAPQAEAPFDPQAFRQPTTLFYANLRPHCFDPNSLRFFPQNSTTALLPESAIDSVIHQYSVNLDILEDQKTVEVSSFRVTPLETKDYIWRFGHLHTDCFQFVVETQDEKTLHITDLGYQEDFIQKLSKHFPKIDTAILPIDVFPKPSLLERRRFTFSEALKFCEAFQVNTLIPGPHVYSENERKRLDETFENLKKEAALRTPDLNLITLKPGDSYMTKKKG